MWMETAEEGRIEIKDVRTNYYLPVVYGRRGKEYYIARNHKEAGEAAADYWYNLAYNDPKEFAAIMGTETLVAWIIPDQYATTGNYSTKSFPEWLEIVKNYPEEEWAHSNMIEMHVTDMSKETQCFLEEALNWTLDEEDIKQIVMYRAN